MNRRTGLAEGLTVAAFYFAVLSPGAISGRAQSIVSATWNNSTGNWTTALDWNCPGSRIHCVPKNGGGSSYDVFISTAGANVTLNNTSTPSSITINALSLPNSDTHLAVGNGASLTVNGKAFVTNNSDIDVSGTLSAGSLTVTDYGLVYGPGEVTVRGSVTNEAGGGVIGHLTAASLTNMDGGFLSSGGNVTISGSVINGAGSGIEQDAAGPGQPPVQSRVGGDVLNAGTITLFAQYDNLNTVTVGGSLTNSGSIVLNDVTGGTSKLSVAGDISNSGSVGITRKQPNTGGLGGMISAGGPYKQTTGITDVDGTLMAPTVEIAGGQLLGSGTIKGDLVNDHVVAPGDPSWGSAYTTLSVVVTRRAPTARW